MDADPGVSQGTSRSWVRYRFGELSLIGRMVRFLRLLSRSYPDGWGGPDGATGVAVQLFLMLCGYVLSDKNSDE